MIEKIDSDLRKRGSPADDSVRPHSNSLDRTSPIPSLKAKLQISTLNQLVMLHSGKRGKTPGKTIAERWDYVTPSSEAVV
jgi:hypothetical protein